MERQITGFHQDHEGDWVAELACGHAQHVRHQPPFQLRPWVLTHEGRGDRLGSVLACPWCDGDVDVPVIEDPANGGEPAGGDPEDAGGDPACLAHLLCPACGGVLEEDHLEGCPVKDT